MLSYKECRKKMLQYVLAAIALLFVSVACEKDSDTGVATSASFKFDVVDCETTVNQLLLTGGENLTFTATITEGNSWLSFASNNPGESVKSGPFTPVVFVYLQKNATDDDRVAKVTVAFSNGDFYELTLIQQRFAISAPYDKGWAEQPEFKSNADYVYKTYYTTLANKDYVRNYSICYDTEKKVAHWVAYPLHKVYTLPNVGRTDAWAYDPNVQLPVIPNSDQQYVISSYGTGYARGHQCPSADRYSTVDTNKQTFYATNLMPQNSTFNGGIWGKLENKIRDVMGTMQKDTLYVVTGTHFADGRTTTDKQGNRIGLPSNCWKVLLRTKSGNTGKAIQNCLPGELIGIGFWFANNSSNGDDLPSHSLSIAEIEELTGFTFFRNLPADAVSFVKGQNDPAEWNIR